MKRSSLRHAVIAGGFAISALAVPMSAQTPKEKVDTIVMTGCVAAGATADQYMLSNAEVEAVASTSPNIMHSAPKADMAKDGKPVSYQLKGGDVKGHLGHKVAVTGLMEDAKPMGNDHQTAGAHSAAGAMNSGAAGVLNVKSVKMIAMTCS